MLTSIHRALISSTPNWVLPGVGTNGADLFFSKNIAYAGGQQVAPSSQMVVTRAQTVNSYAQTSGGGLIPFPANTPRITDQGLLVEQASTNLVLQSQNLITSWNVSNSTPLANQAVAPDGTTTATQVTDSGTTGSHSIFGSNFSTTGATVYTASVYVKAGTLRYISFRSEAVATSTYPWLTLDTQVGTITNNAASTASFGVLALGNGWYRVSITFTALGNTSNGNLVVAGSNVSTAPTSSTTTGNSYTGTGQTFFAWGAQLEALGFATSYITTTTSTVTRAADVITLQGAALTAALNAKAARFVTKAGTFNSGTNANMLHYGGGAGLVFPGSSSTQVQITNGTNSASAVIGGSGSISGLVKSAFGFDASSMTAIANGGTSASAANAWSGNTGTVYIGQNNGIAALNGYIARATFGPTKGMWDSLTTGTNPS